MKRIALFTLYAMLAAASPAIAAGETGHAMIESSIETTGAGVRIPDSPVGRIEITDCEHCRDRALQLSASTRFTINGAQVTQAQLRSAANGAADKLLTIHYTLVGLMVTRVDLVSF